jgi:hypothetical protein
MIPPLMNPLLLLDVDGPLNPWKAKPHLRPAGYETFRFPVASCYPRKPLRVWLRRDVGARLRELADAYGFELVWATSWQDEANEFIAPAIGLPALPVIALPGRDRRDWHRTTWKWDAVAEFAADRPLAWVDDEFHDSWNIKRIEPFTAARTAPTALCNIDPRVGLDEPDFTALALFGSICQEAA